MAMQFDAIIRAEARQGAEKCMSFHGCPFRRPLKTLRLKNLDCEQSILGSARQKHDPHTSNTAFPGWCDILGLSGSRNTAPSIELCRSQSDNTGAISISVL